MTAIEPALILTEKQYERTCWWRWLQGAAFGVGLGLVIGIFTTGIFIKETPWPKCQAVKKG